MKNTDDIRLVAKVAVYGDKKAFDVLVMKYQESIRRFFMAQTLGDVQLSDDLAQDTFIKAYTGIRHFRGVSGFSTWLYRIAYNVMYDWRRALKPSDTIDGHDSCGVTCNDNEVRLDIYKALKVLNETERCCVTLQLMHGMSTAGIAEAMNMSEGTVKSNLSRGKHKMAEYLRQNGYDRR
ncbi:MAG: RNA polymerase sigma factor [Prevotella sp.]